MTGTTTVDIRTGTGKVEPAFNEGFGKRVMALANAVRETGTKGELQSTRESRNGDKETVTAKFEPTAASNRPQTDTVSFNSGSQTSPTATTNNGFNGFSISFNSGAQQPAPQSSRSSQPQTPSNGASKIEIRVVDGSLFNSRTATA
ncbi:MAG: hypothetical protein SFU25_02560 [Candidatus Caenarcaniphilales bacterium]|nr:hypothetical protein [Candidatus Caenarcaniphilales bacterium]